MAISWSLRVGDINSAAPEDVRPADPDTPFRILVLGNFSGQKAVRVPLNQRKPTLVDRDNVEEVLGKCGAEVTVPAGPDARQQLGIEFRTLEDFEPEQLYQRLSVFEELRRLRRRLRDPAQFAAAVAEIKSWATAPAANEEPAPAPAAAEPASVLEEILGTKITPADATPGGADWNQFLQQIVEPYTLARTDPRLPDFEAIVDEGIGARMRAVLHDPAFQEVEAAWRGLVFLVRRLETDAQLKVYVLDVNKAELAQDVVGADDLAQTGMYRHLVERTVGTPGAEPWAAVVGLYTFGLDPQDPEILANLARLTRQAGAPFLAGAHSALAGAHSALAGCSSFADSPDARDWHDQPPEPWQQLRQLPESQFLGLALPRFLLRLPYGKDSTTIEQFAFEELPAGAPHEHYLWGNPALICAVLLGQSFTQSGWNLRAGALAEVNGLPVAIYREDGEAMAKPCAEVMLTGRSAERLLDCGLMALQSVKDRDAVRLTRFQSMAAPPAPLAGRWS